jgi:hypothetical protein
MLFSQVLRTYYVEQLAAPQRLLQGQKRLRFGILLSPLEPSAEFEQLKSRWTAGEGDLSAAVRSGLLSGALRYPSL